MKARAWGQMVPGQVQQHLAGLRHQAEQLQHAHKAPQARPSRILHYHCDHLGTPRELTDEDGKLVWSASYWAWGKLRNPKGRSGGAGTDIASPDAPRNQFWHTRTQPGRSNHLPEWVADNAGSLKRWRELKDAEEPQNTPEAANDPSVWGEQTDQSIRFQGQWHDPETGLHYNRFRYYDPDVGRFIHQDPIGFGGGINWYQYAPNPTGWIDPFGLAGQGGTYMFEWALGGKYIGKGLEGRFRDSKKKRRKGPKDCLLGEAWIDTGGDNELGKMVEYQAMRQSGFARGNIPSGFSNSYLSGESTFKDASPEKQDKAKELARELILKFQADKASKKAQRAMGRCPI